MSQDYHIPYYRQNLTTEIVCGADSRLLAKAPKALPYRLPSTVITPSRLSENSARGRPRDFKSYKPLYLQLSQRRTKTRKKKRVCCQKDSVFRRVAAPWRRLRWPSPSLAGSDPQEGRSCLFGSERSPIQERSVLHPRAYSVPYIEW